MNTGICTCQHAIFEHNIHDENGDTFCEYSNCKCQVYENFDWWAMLADVEKLVTEIDLALWTWQTDLDMMSFIGQGVPIKTYVPEEPREIDMTVRRVPLVKWEGGKRIVIGVAEVDDGSGVVKAEVHAEHAEILSMGHEGAFSIADEDPPLYDHTSIKTQLKHLALPHLYSNPFKIQGVTVPFPKVEVKTNAEPAWGGLSEDEMIDYYDKHPFFNKES